MDMKQFRVLGGRLTFQRVGHEWLATWVNQGQPPATAVALGSIAIPLIDASTPDGATLREAFMQLMRSAAVSFVQLQCGIRPEIGDMVPVDEAEAKSFLANAQTAGSA